MKSRLFSSILAAFLMVSLIAPPALLVVPRTTYAQDVPVGDWLTRIKETLNLISTYTNTAANVAQQINTYVLQPLAFVMSGNLMKLLTAGVLDFVIGATNGTGAPQFVQNVNGMMQRVGDIQANAFFIQFGRNSNSPFAASITSSLRTNYLWNTSSAGFFAANRNTMSMYSPNPNAFMAGNWSQGGVGAWFALTTQTQNNPYTLYQASQSHLASVVGSAQSARRAVLDWGQGFMAWCGPSENGPTVGVEDGTEMEGVNPGDVCYDKDGNAGTIKTPGATIKATLDKVLGGTQDKLVQMGSVAKEVNGILGSVGSILGNVGTVAGTVMFASNILGGSNSGGLFGVGQTSGTNSTSRLLQYQSPGYLGVTQSTVIQNAGTLTTAGSDMVGRLNQYESSWNAIRSAALSASTTVASLASFCEAAANSRSQYSDYLSASSAQASAARTAITSSIAPIIVHADAARAIISAARVVLGRLQNNENATSQAAGAAYLADLQTLQSMPPSDQQISDAMQDAQSVGTAIAIPAGSLAVSGGTIVSRMSLISTNAETLKATVCTESVYVPANNGYNNDQG